MLCAFACSNLLCNFCCEQTLVVAHVSFSTFPGIFLPYAALSRIYIPYIDQISNSWSFALPNTTTVDGVCELYTVSSALAAYVYAACTHTYMQHTEYIIKCDDFKTSRNMDTITLIAYAIPLQTRKFP